MSIVPPTRGSTIEPKYDSDEAQAKMNPNVDVGSEANRAKVNDPPKKLRPFQNCLQ